MTKTSKLYYMLLGKLNLSKTD